MRSRAVVALLGLPLLGAGEKPQPAFWGPMAFAIIGGLAVATVLTLIFLPALDVAWFRVSEPAHQPSASSEPTLHVP